MSVADWPTESATPLQPGALVDPDMPSDVQGVIGYCSDRTIGDIPGTLVSPSTVHQSAKDAKNYLFGSELEKTMRESLEQYTQVFCVII